MSITDELTENQIQRAVFDNFKARKTRGVFPFHPKNGSSDHRGRRAGIAVGMGVVPGIPDVMASKRVEGVTALLGFALELKRESRRGKKETEHEKKQRECREDMAASGWITGVAYGLNEALQWLEQQGLLKGSAGGRH